MLPLIKSLFTTTESKWIFILPILLLVYIGVTGIMSSINHKNKDTLEQQLVVKTMDLDKAVQVQKETEEVLKKQESVQITISKITTEEQHNLFEQSKKLEAINAAKQRQIRNIEKHYDPPPKKKEGPHYSVTQKVKTTTTTHHSTAKKKAISKIQITALWSTYCLYTPHSGCHG